MEILIKAGQLILSLSILVLLHEFGHFIFAKIFKARVEKFYLFFNPWFSLFKIKKGETEFGVGWLPLGGYCKISGMIDESMDKEQMSKPPEPHEFRSKKGYQRLLIMLGGVLFNFLTAFFIYSMILFTWGETYLPTDNAKHGIYCDTLATDMGFRNGDIILSIDNKHVEDFTDIFVELLYNEVTSIQVKRNGRKVDVSIPNDFVSQYLERRNYYKENVSKDYNFIVPEYPFIVGDFSEDSVGENAGLEKGDKIIALNDEEISGFNHFSTKLGKFDGNTVKISVDRKGEIIDYSLTLSENRKIEVFAESMGNIIDLETKEFGFFASIPAGIKKGSQSISNYLKDIKLIFSPKTKAYKELGGFIAIGNIFPDTWDWFRFWQMTALLSIMLAVINLLPIPALDGGHVLFLVFEIITGRKPADKFLEYAQIVGMILLLALVLFANGNDIIKLFR